MQQIITEIVSKAKAHIDSQGGLKTLYFVGCGGSWASMVNAKCLVERETEAGLITGHVNSSEFVHAIPKNINKNAIVIVTSLKATAESVEALRAAKAKGAYTIAITGFTNSEMAINANAFIVYHHSSNWTANFHSPAVALRIAFEILHQFENYKLYDAAIKAIDSVNDIYEEQAKRAVPKAIRFGLDNKSKEIFHIFSCGTMYGVGYTAAYCHLAEMQQRNAVPMHCGEYFHGAFETTTPEQASILFMGCGLTRPLDERVERFLKQYCNCLTIIDSKDLGLEHIDPQIVDYIAPLVVSPIFKLYVKEMAEQRQHPMSLRRYMWKMEY